MSALVHDKPSTAMRTIQPSIDVQLRFGALVCTGRTMPASNVVTSSGLIYFAASVSSAAIF
jgi:hypothetical protein